MSFQLSTLPARLYRLTRFADPLQLPSWEIIRQHERGRWDDTAEDYRVLYCADSLNAACVETLADLRQNARALGALSAVEGDEDEPEFDPRQLAYRRLSNRWSAVLIPSNPEDMVTDVAAGASRTQLENDLAPLLQERKIESLKIGDLTGTDRGLSRHASRAIYEHGYGGLVAPSAEHAKSKTFALFEAQPVSMRFRVELIAEKTALALTDPATVAAMADALSYLGLTPSGGQPSEAT